MCNLFTLRWDLYFGQFDQARFVIVPKSDQLVIHFLLLTDQSAQQYDNIQVDHKDSLSHELLYACFAWALMKIAKDVSLDLRVFNFLCASETKQCDIEGTTDDGGGSEHKRKHDGNEDEDDGHNTSGPSRNLRSSQHTMSDGCSQEGKT